MTCKQCLHDEVCNVQGYIDADECYCFRDKANFVEVEKYNELREDFIDFACSGVNNLAPYCKNRCAECVDERGWCRHTIRCKGFNPDGERK